MRLEEFDHITNLLYKINITCPIKYSIILYHLHLYGIYLPYLDSRQYNYTVILTIWLNTLHTSERVGIIIHEMCYYSGDGCRIPISGEYIYGYVESIRLHNLYEVLCYLEK